MSKGICKYFSDCGFFNKHASEAERKDETTIFHQYIKVYCHGELKQDCIRYLQKEKTGIGLPDDITPTGISYKLDEEGAEKLSI